jgi:flagellar protein FliS
MTVKVDAHSPSPAEDLTPAADSFPREHMSSRAANAYRRVYVESASPARVLDELLRGLHDDLVDARARIAAGDPAGKGKRLGRALAILGELRGALDAQVAPELCANLARLYDWMIDEINVASVKMDAQRLVAVATIVGDLRESFQTAARSAG